MTVFKMTAYKKIAIAALATPVLFFVSFLASKHITSQHEVVLESLESKTVDNQAVFNKISLQEGHQQDIWRMRQTHSGFHAGDGQWDELQITVDKSSRPFRASFYQLKNGTSVEYRVSCFMCHANGPRAIAPNWQSSQVQYSWTDRLSVLLWNLKIKHYGTIITPEATSPTQMRQIPLAFNSAADHDILKVKTCLLCHAENEQEISHFKRAPLKRQHAVAIEFMVTNGRMPPYPLTLSAEEKSQIQHFIDGE